MITISILTPMLQMENNYNCHLIIEIDLKIFLLIICKRSFVLCVFKKNLIHRLDSMKNRKTLLNGDKNKYIKQLQQH